MEEHQSFHPFFTALAVFVAVFINFMLVYQTELNVWFVLGIMILNSIAALIFLFSKMKTTYDKEGVTIKFFPFILKEKHISWSEIDTAVVRQYAPIKEFGGWGIRYSRKRGNAYNVRGNYGVQLVFKTGKKLLIGTQENIDLQLFLNNLYSNNIVNKPSEN